MMRICIVIVILLTFNEAHNNDFCTDTGLVDGLMRVCLRSIPEDDVIAEWYRNKIEDDVIAEWYKNRIKNGSNNPANKVDEVVHNLSTTRQVEITSSIRDYGSGRLEKTTKPPFVTLMRAQNPPELQNFIRMMQLLIDTASEGLNQAEPSQGTLVENDKETHAERSDSLHKSSNKLPKDADELTRGQEGPRAYSSNRDQDDVESKSSQQLSDAINRQTSSESNIPASPTLPRELEKLATELVRNQQSGRSFNQIQTGRIRPSQTDQQLQDRHNLNNYSPIIENIPDLVTNKALSEHRAKGRENLVPSVAEQDHASNVPNNSRLVEYLNRIMNRKNSRTGMDLINDNKLTSGLTDSGKKSNGNNIPRINDDYKTRIDEDRYSSFDRNGLDGVKEYIDFPKIDNINGATKELNTDRNSAEELLQLLSKPRSRRPRSVAAELHNTRYTEYSNDRDSVSVNDVRNYALLKDTILQIKLQQMQELLDSISALSSTNSTNLINAFLNVYKATSETNRPNTDKANNKIRSPDFRQKNSDVKASKEKLPAYEHSSNYEEQNERSKTPIQRRSAMIMAAQNLLLRCCLRGCSDSDLMSFCHGYGY